MSKRNKKGPPKRRKVRKVVQASKARGGDVLAWLPQSELPPVEMRVERRG